MFLKQSLKLILIILFFCNDSLHGKQALEDSLQVQCFLYQFTTQNGLPSNETYSVIKDKQGYIWVGTDRGITKYDGYTFKVFTQADGITDNVIFDMFEDSTGMLWFATFNKKIFTYTEKKGFTAFKYNNVIDSLTSDITFHASRIFVDSLDNVIIQDYRKHYLIIDKFGKGEFKNIIKDEGTLVNNIKLQESEFSLRDDLSKSGTRIENKFISDIDQFLNKERICQAVKDNDGGIWVATLNSGVYYFPNPFIKMISSSLKIRGIIPQGSTISYATKDNHFVLKNTNSIVKNRIFETFTLANVNTTENRNQIEQQSYKFYNHLTFNSSDTRRIWGVQIDRNNQIISWGVNYINFSEKSEPFNSNQRITAFHSLRKGVNLIGTLDGLFTLKNDKLEKYKFHFGTIDTRVQDIKYDEQNDMLYIATLGNGLYVTKSDSLIEHLNINDGLNSNSINQLCLDANNTIWIATNAGVNYLKYTKADIAINKLLPSNKYYNSQNVSQVLVRDSIIHIGTDNGISIVDQHWIDNNPFDRFPLYITNVYVNKKEINSDAFNNSYLDHDQNNITIKYLGLSLQRFGDIAYRYRLHGEQNDEWYITNETTATFQNLLPGEYHFEIQYQNKDKMWIETNLDLGFIINKPFWKTAWFIILSMLLFITLISLVFFKYYNAQKRRSSLINELNNTKQMAITAQLNPHFVFNSLNSIQNFILKNDRNLSNDYLGKFSLLMRKVFENSKELYISLQDELDAVQAYFELENVRHKNSIIMKKNIQLTDSPEKLKIPSLILQPIIENSINHGIVYLEKLGVIKLDVQDDENYLYINISDNGKGREYSDKMQNKINHKSSGIELTSKRLELLSKQFNKQARIKTTDLMDQDGNLKGTRVELIIPKIYESV